MRLPFLKTSGSRIVDESGKEVVLKGVNLGGWLMMEGYMFGGRNTPEHEFRSSFEKAIGKVAFAKHHGANRQTMPLADPQRLPDFDVTETVEQGQLTQQDEALGVRGILVRNRQVIKKPHQVLGKIIPFGITLITILGQGAQHNSIEFG